MENVERKGNISVAEKDYERCIGRRSKSERMYVAKKSEYHPKLTIVSKHGMSWIVVDAVTH